MCQTFKGSLTLRFESFFLLDSPVGGGIKIRPNKILQYVSENKYQVSLPTREVYLKGPGMIFRGNPKNYLTEIQMLIAAAS
jgi:hypothetical protein